MQNKNRRSKKYDYVQRDKRKELLANDCDWYDNLWETQETEQLAIVKDKIARIIKDELKNALQNLSINIEVNPEINIINDTQREVAIGKKGVGAGENTNIGIVGKDGSAGAGYNPELASTGQAT